MVICIHILILCDTLKNRIRFFLISFRGSFKAMCDLGDFSLGRSRDVSDVFTNIGLIVALND